MKTCPSCDVLAPTDARYCRHCGAQLKRVGAASGAGDGSISPIAATVPLSSQNPTDQIVAHPPPQSAAPHTSEVTRAEMDDLLRRGTRAGADQEEAANRASGEQLPPAPARDAQQVASSAHHAGRFHGNDSSDSSYDDFDSEQTQITISVRPFTSRNLPADAAAATSSASVVAARANTNPQFNATPQQVTLSPDGSLQQDANMTTTVAVAAPPPLMRPTTVRSTEARAFRVWIGLGLAALSVAVIGGVAMAAFWFGSRSLRASEGTPAVLNGEAVSRGG